MVRLERLGGDNGDEARVFEEDVVRIGRAESCELQIDAVHISAEHASIVFVGDAHVVRDHHSTNGTRVVRSGKVTELAEQSSCEMVLESGDELQVGDAETPVRLLVHLDEEPDSTRIVSLRHVAEIEQVEAEVGADRELLRRLYQAQKVISRATTVDEVLSAVAAEVFEFLSRATHVTAALREETEDGGRRRSSRYVPVGTRVRDASEAAEAIPITRSVFKKVVAERAAVLAADARSEVGETASLMAAKILSTIGVPLWSGDEILGVLQVDNRAASGMFKEQDLDVLAVLAQATGQAFSHAQLVQRLTVAEERARSENVYFKARDKKERGNIIGDSRAMRSLFDQLKKVVDTRVTVLIDGETGTGKELVASAVHYWSKRASKLFVAQNCAAMPENLLESELFGHRKGAFTGATEDKKGLFTIADGGTLFLDEVGEMPTSLQVKLLRVLQEGEIRPVGSNTTRRVDVRIVAATNRDLEEDVRQGRFREDLFYRLRVFPLRVPPLRERPEDLPALATHFLERYSQEFGRRTGGISQPAMEVMQSYKWPGNVRELENEVQRLVIQLEDGEFVKPTHLSSRIRQVENVLDQVRPTKGTLRQMVEQVEKWILLEALREHGNNKTATAKTLGITREGLHKKLKNYGMT